MKWLFFILLLANLGMFILIYPQKAEKSSKNSLSDIGDLYLYEESTELTGEAGAGERPIAGENSEAEFQETEQSEEDRNEAGAPDQIPGTDEGLEPMVVSEPETTTMEEISATEPDAALAVGEEDAIETPAAVEAPICTTIGYLESRSDAEVVSVRLRALGLKPELQSETSNEQAGVWVLVPPQGSRRKAIAIANRLEKDGITDLWRFTSGELVHAISLGLFRNEERAEARRKEITDLGYDVIIKPRYRQQTKYWLYYQEGTPSVITQKIWNGLVADFPNLEAKESPCR